MIQPEIILRAVQENYRNNQFTVEMLIGILPVSQSVLYDLTKSYYGITPRQIIERHRIAHAAHLLALQSGIAESCVASGYSCINSFTKAFNRVIGMKPEEWRSYSAANPPEHVAQLRLRLLQKIQLPEQVILQQK